MTEASPKRRRRSKHTLYPAARARTGGDWCYYCGRTEGPQGCNVYDGCRHPHHDRLHVDHVVPLSRGGSDTEDNVVIACSSCNLSKGSKLLCAWEGRWA